MKIWRPSVENIKLGLRPRVTFSTSGSSYFHVPLSHMLNASYVKCWHVSLWTENTPVAYYITSVCLFERCLDYDWTEKDNFILSTNITLSMKVLLIRRHTHAINISFTSSFLFILHCYLRHKRIWKFNTTYKMELSHRRKYIREEHLAHSEIRWNIGFDYQNQMRSVPRW